MIVFIYGIILLVIVFIILRSRKKPSPTIKWFNTTYAILTVANRESLDHPGGLTNSLINKSRMEDRLKEWWGIESKEEADSTINWLVNEGGHNIELLKSNSKLRLYTFNLNDSEKILNTYSGRKKLIAQTFFEAYGRFGEKAILGWDLSRAMFLYGACYVAGYYTYEEAMDKSLALAKTIQHSFNSWEDFIESYLLGHKYWVYTVFDDYSGSASPEHRRKIYNKILNRKENPFKELEWNMEFKKTW